MGQQEHDLTKCIIVFSSLPLCFLAAIFSNITVCTILFLPWSLMKEWAKINCSFFRLWLCRMHVDDRKVTKTEFCTGSEIVTMILPEGMVDIHGGNLESLVDTSQRSPRK